MVIEVIKSETGINFSYDPNKIHVSRKGTVAEILDATLKPNRISYSIVAKTVLLKLAKKPKDKPSAVSKSICGGSRRFDGFFEIASEYAFILDLWDK